MLCRVCRCRCRCRSLFLTLLSLLGPRAMGDVAQHRRPPLPSSGSSSSSSSSSSSGSSSSSSSSERARKTFAAKNTCEFFFGWARGGDNAVCKDIDVCDGVVCGGESKCIDGWCIVVVAYITYICVFPWKSLNPAPSTQSCCVLCAVNRILPWFVRC